ncbi:MAG: hypothetical protein ACOVQM_07395 [Pirellula sp.]
MLKSKTQVGLFMALVSVFFVFCIIKIASAGYQFGRWLNPSPSIVNEKRE